MTLGEIAAEIELVSITEDRSLRTGGEYRNILGAENVNTFTFLNIDLFKGHDISLSAEGLEEIKKALNEINLATGASGYVVIGWGYEIGIEPITTVEIILEEFKNYDSIK